MDHGIRAEHFRSVLPERASDIDDEALAIQTALNQDFDAVLQEFRDRQRPSKQEEREWREIKDYPR